MLDARADDFAGDVGGIGGDVSHLSMDHTGAWSKKGRLTFWYCTISLCALGVYKRFLLENMPQVD